MMTRVVSSSKDTAARARNRKKAAAETTGVTPTALLTRMFLSLKRALTCCPVTATFPVTFDGGSCRGNRKYLFNIQTKPINRKVTPALESCKSTSGAAVVRALLLGDVAVVVPFAATVDEGLAAVRLRVVVKHGEGGAARTGVGRSGAPL